MYRIAVIGVGYVGLVTGACLSDFGLNVIGVDNDKNKIKKLESGEIPIYEPGLEDIVKRNIFYKRLVFTTSINKAIEECNVIFIAVGTPTSEDGNADLRYVEEVAVEIATYMNDYKTVVVKSTVPVGTGKLVKRIISDELDKLGKDYEFDVVSNPEFLREGSAVYDFTHPDRVIIGSESERAANVMKSVYRVLYLNETPFIDTNIETSEMIKYASNAFLAMKITFINEMANLCEKVGANIQQVATAMGKDGRIGSKFLHPGPGYGGSCFPKDTKALVEIGKKYSSDLLLVESTIAANEKQKLLMVDKITNSLNGVEGKQLAILGLSFKPNTDDMRYAPSVLILNELAKKGAKFKVYDPVAIDESRKVLKNIEDKICYSSNEYEAIEDSDALIIITEWNQFRNLDINKIKLSLKNPILIDLRNIYKRKDIEACGLTYVGVGQ